MKANANDHVAHQKVDALAAGAHGAVDWAADTTNNAADRLSHTGQEMRARQEKWLAASRGYVKENPTTSIGLALASGYVLGRLLRMR